MKTLNPHAKLMICIVPYLFIIRILLRLQKVSNFINHVEAYNALFGILLSVLILVLVIMGINQIVKWVYNAEELEKQRLHKGEKKRFLIGLLIFAIAMMVVTAMPPFSYIFSYTQGTPYQYAVRYFNITVVAVFGGWYAKKIIREREQSN